MTIDYVIQLTLATFKVADILPPGEPLALQLKDSSSRLLTSMILLLEKNPVTPEQKLGVAPRAIREAGILGAYLSYAKRVSLVNPVNFTILEREYVKVSHVARKLHEELLELRPSKEEWATVPKPSPVQRPQPAPRPVAPSAPKPSGVSPRQKRILALMEGKEKVQVGELQKVFPEVTKRTLRRDMDDLLNRNLIIRKGEWNQVYYQIIPKTGE